MASKFFMLCCILFSANFLQGAGAGDRHIRDAWVSELILNAAERELAQLQELPYSSVHKQSVDGYIEQEDAEQKQRRDAWDKNLPVGEQDEGDERDYTYVAADVERKQSFHGHAGASGFSGHKVPPIGTLAYAGKALARHYQHYTDHIKEQLLLHNVPTVLGALVAQYADYQWRLSKRFQLHKNRVSDLGWASEEHAVSGSIASHDCLLWDMQTGIVSNTEPLPAVGFAKKTPKEFHLPLIGTVQYISFDTSSDKIALVHFPTGELHLWDKNIPHARALTQGGVTSFIKQKNGVRDGFFLTTHFSFCDNYLLAGATDGIVDLINVQTKDTLCSLAHEAGVTALVVAPGNRILVGLDNGTVCVWEGESLEALNALFSADQSAADSAVLLAPDPMLMVERPVSIPDVVPQQFHDSDVNNIRCLVDCAECVDATQACFKLLASCCRIGISCLTSCPRFIGFACCSGCRYCCQSAVRCCCPAR